MQEKILVVNDDDGIREMALFILETKGYNTIAAANGLDALELANQHNPDLILLDIMMPEMDGYETCQKLKASPATMNIPVLFFSSLTNPKDKIKGLELGAVDFINNVVDQGELLARVQTHLQIQSLTRSLMESNEQLTRKQKALDDDLEAAAMIQRSYIPANNLVIPNLQLASVWLPANPLGGDIFNAIKCGQNKVIIYMIDVSGHDVPSALVTVSVSQYLNQQNAPSCALLSPKQTMLNLDKEYPLERFNRYFTLFYIILDIQTGTLSYSCAGHPAAVLLSKNNTIRLLDRGGTIIGLNQGLPFEEGTEQLIKGDKIILYTDGVTEMKNLEGEFYGTERLHTLLEKKAHEPVAEIVNSIQISLNDFGQGVSLQDDMSIMCLEWRGN